MKNTPVCDDGYWHALTVNSGPRQVGGTPNLLSFTVTSRMFRGTMRRVSFQSRRCVFLLLPALGVLFSIHRAVILETADRPDHNTTVESSALARNVSNPPQSEASSQSSLLVRNGDFIYRRRDWDGSPIVMEDYRLVFFTAAKVGCTVWKQLFRRMMGYTDWAKQGGQDLLPWNPATNGLYHLYNYNRTVASRIMTDPSWTRAIFVREPKERLVSAYLDKAVRNSKFTQRRCCRGGDEECYRKVKDSLRGFFDAIQTCDDSHWRPQSRRMEGKYWPYINFVGHLETVSDDARILLLKIGAWDAYGSTGWGKHGNESIFGSSAGGSGRRHATNAKQKLKTYLTPELERLVEDYYANDYAHPVLNLTRKSIFDD